MTVYELLDQVVKLPENSVLAITSKVVSICENNVIPVKDADEKELIKKEADYYLPFDTSKYNYNFTIKNRTLISNAGIDESNGGGMFVLWPKDPQKAANEIRKYLKDKFGLNNLGVIISDSTLTPLRLGTMGIAIAHSGFAAANNYVGKPDLFGRPFKVSQSNVAGGLAAAGAVVMGEATEQTPIVIIEDVPFVEFQDRDPTREELDEIRISPEDDIFAPLINSVKWLPGDKSKNS